MSIIEQPLPQHPAPYPPLHVVTPDRDDEIKALQVTAARLAEERDAQKLRADQAEAAGINTGNVLAATRRREIQLTTRLRMALRNVHDLEQRLDEKHADLRHTSELYAASEQANRDLRTELGAAEQEIARLKQTRRLLRRRVQAH